MTFSFMEENRKICLPAEWFPQSGVMLTWPHPETDWADILDEVENCFIHIASHISQREKLLIVCPDKNDLVSKLQRCRFENILFAELPANDTWARDHGPLTVFIDDKPVIYDFTFNGWGLKFASNHDNQVSRKIFNLDLFSEEVGYKNMLHFILEGGSIESDGNGTILTTKECLCSINRNQYLSQKEIENHLIEIFGLKRVLWLSSGYLAGDDTDSHIDTLARFCDEKTIAYVECNDPSDEHYVALKKMEDELKSFRTLSHEPYCLIPLPMAEAVYDENTRLPATYANFLIINSVVLLPFYNSPKDQVARQQLQKIFTDREVIGIDCLPLIKQHGSLHCVTMQFPLGVIS
jgi:agmatine deiminase